MWQVLWATAWATEAHGGHAERGTHEAVDSAVLDGAFAAAAARHTVPEDLLRAIAWEASRFDPWAEAEQWPAKGLFGLRTDDRNPSLAKASSLVGMSESSVLASAEAQIDAAAAFLAYQGALTGADTADLASWRDALRAFSGSDAPARQDRYVAYIMGVLRSGADSRLDIAPHADLSVPPPPPGGSAPDSPLAADWVPACDENYSDYERGDADIDTIVLHTVQGSYSSAINWFANCSASVSAHYVVRSSDGEITQTLAEEDVGWHAGHWETNARSVGIEHEGYVEDPEEWYTDAMMQASAALVRDIATRRGIPLDRDHIIGHHEVPGCSSGSGGGSGCHIDPGSGFDWSAFMDLVVEGDLATIRGVVREGDLTNGAAVVGATVRLVGGNASATTDESGYFEFPGLATGEWTVRAQADGFEAGTCSREVTAGDNWCSIALQPAVDTAPPVDTAEPIPEDPNYVPEPERPWGARAEDEPKGGCACASSSGPPPAAWWFGLLGLVVARRRDAAAR